MDKEDEMTCLIKGCNFVLKNIPHEAFVYAKHADSEFRFQTTQPDIFPYLLVNIGSGVSIVKVITSALTLKSFLFFSLFLFGNMPCMSSIYLLMKETLKVHDLPRPERINGSDG